jgi:hypothetical protein
LWQVLPRIIVGAGRLGIAISEQNAISPNRLALVCVPPGETGGRKGINKRGGVSHLSRPYAMWDENNNWDDFVQKILDAIRKLPILVFL